jgi:hypothetical protein
MRLDHLPSRKTPLKVELLIRINFTLPTLLFLLLGLQPALFKLHIELRLPHHENLNQHFLNIHFKYLSFKQGGQTQQATPISDNETLVPTNEVEQ